MADSLGTYFGPNETGLATVVPGVMQTGLGQVLMQNRQLGIQEKARKQKQQKEDVAGVKSFVNDLTGKLEWKALNQYLDDNQHSEYKTLFNDIVDYEKNVMYSGGKPDGARERELENRANDWLYTRGRTKLVIDDTKSITDLADKSKIYKMGEVNETVNKLFQERDIKDLDPEQIQEAILYNPNLIDESQLAKTITEGFAEQTREVLSQSGGTITETVYKNKLPILFDKTDDGQLTPRIDDDGNFMLDLDNPMLITTFKGNKASDIKAQAVRKQLQETNPDATYQDAIKQILSSQNVVEEQKTTKVDSEWMFNMRQNAKGGGSGKDKYNWEVVTSSEDKYKSLGEVGDDGVISSEVKVLETPNLVRNVNFDVSNEELGMTEGPEGQDPSRNFDVEGFEVTSEGKEYVKVQTKNDVGDLITKRIELTPKRKSAILNSIPDKKGKEELKARLKEMKEAEFNNKYLDKGKVDKLEGFFKEINSADVSEELKQQSFEVLLGKFFPKAEIKFTEESWWTAGGNKVSIDGKVFDLKKQKDIDALKELTVSKNKDAFSTEDKPQSKKSQPPTPDPLKPEELVIQVNDSTTDVTNIFKQ
jgi:hypothetical protein